QEAAARRLLGVPAEEWAAEVSIDAALVRRVLAAQFPELDLVCLRLLGEGWDNSVWIVDERWVFRFPRREVAVAPGERQVVLLPRLAPRLALPLPRPPLPRPPARPPARARSPSPRAARASSSAGRSSVPRSCPGGRPRTSRRTTRRARGPLALS